MFFTLFSFPFSPFSTSYRIPFYYPFSLAFLSFCLSFLLQLGKFDRILDRVREPIFFLFFFCMPFVFYFHMFSFLGASFFRARLTCCI
jgi:hypothetical protein